MERKIVLDNQEISYCHKKTRQAKHLTITVRCDATILVTTPHYFSIRYIEQTLKKQAKWILKKVILFQNSDNVTRLGGGVEEYKRHKSEAYDFIFQRINELNKIYNFSYNRISIRNQTTLWGSCSQKGNLNFNYKVIFLAPHLAQYIIAHELCHLRELNHSPRFWQLVAQAVPDYKQRVKELKVRALM